MKPIIYIFAAMALLLVSSCSKYDDSALTGRVDDLENRVAQLEQLCKQMNTNISSLQTIVTALQTNDCITGITPVTEKGKEIGYTISFTKNSPITITTARRVKKEKREQQETMAIRPLSVFDNMMTASTIGLWTAIG